MIRMLYSCICGSSGEVDDIENLDGCCPRCHEHHGEVSYFCNMTCDEFITELSEMTEKEISKYATAISLCAKDICENKL